MTIFQAIILGLLQGSTEFIPVSSSGHLVLVPWLLGWDPSGLTFTVVVHLGTVVGVLAFFWQDWLQMLRASIEWVKTRRVTPHFKLLLLLVLGVIPTAVLGLLFRSFFERLFESPLFATISLLITAVILYAGEKIGKLKR
ncbi:MAG TPA: undecaprenyl-diphosphate phosphatase, partial [Aggregatilineales bacterium]|nr:undecaprenyl-diphosphate phosphatase [Aggregatilineales bacterium]